VRFSKERDHKLFEYSVLVTHISSKYATFEKEKPWQDGQCSLVAHTLLVWRDLRKRKTMARGRRVVLVAHVHQISLIFEKKRSYATFDTHSSHSYASQDANFQKTETMRPSYPILDCTSSYTMSNFREEEITHNFFGCFFVARNPAVLILFEKHIIIFIRRSSWSHI
jgi:hypothetical protein